MATPDLELRMLGELDVRRAGDPLALPPSKKTRALLAYLALTGRPHRREALCSLLWDVTDDPRGALRWSLSKLRKLTDDEHASRLCADRDHVGIELHGASVDVLEMRAALDVRKLEDAPTALIETWCDRCAGEVLEGLDLPDFDGYQAWLVAEREQTRRLRAAMLGELVRRSDDAPERALPHARTWIAVDPMSAQARQSVMRLLLRAGQVDEAKKQFQSARRLFSELDPSKEKLLLADWQALRSTPESEPPPRSAGAVPPEPPPAELASARISTTPREPTRAPALPLVGRQREHAELSAALAQVTRTRHAQLVLLTGEPGIGKSRLLDELLYEARARGDSVLDGTAFEGETGRPYGPFIDALRKLPGARGAGTVRERLAPLLAAGADAQASSREVLFSGVVDALSALCAARAPVLFVLDDVHWLDEGSAELLHYTARMQREQPVLFVLAARDAELHDQQTVLRVLRSLRRDLDVHEIALGRLPADATRELVRCVDGTADAHKLFAQSAGNPLFALELARAGGAPERARTIADAVRDRVAGLPAEAGEVLRWGAVLGSVIDGRLLRALSSLNPEQQLDGFEELERRALLRLEGENYAFAHEVVRGVVYSGLSQPRRTLMHHRAAEALSTLQARDASAYDEGVVADIARHAALGGDHALAARAHVDAGRRCLKLFASENAAAMVRKGLRHADELAEPERCRSMLELLDIQLWARRPADAEDYCRTVQALAETALHHGCVAHARLGFNMLSYVRWESGNWDEARAQMLKAEQVVRAGEGVDHVDALAEAARCLGLLERDLGHAEAMLIEAKLRAKRLGHESSTLAEADGLLKLHLGELEQADALLEQARILARAESHRYGEIQALMSRFQLHFDEERPELALELALEAEQLADKTRDGSEGPYARVLVALAQLALGREHAQEQLQRALEELRTADAKHRLISGLSRGARLLNRQGQPKLAHGLAEEALEIARFLERPSDIVLALVELARAQRALGDQAGYTQSCRQLEHGTGGKLSAYAEHMRAALNTR